MRDVIWAIPACALVLACASSPKPVQQKVDDSGLARLDESQMQPVDDARVEQGRAQDALSRSRANEADAQARLEVAKTERGVADAQMKRALAERDLLKRQYASQDQLARADEEVRAGQDRIRAADMKRAYLERMVQVAQADRNAAAAHVETANAMVEQAKLRAMKAADVHRFLVVCALVSDLYCPGYNPRQSLAKNSNLSRTAARYKVDSAKMVRIVRVELSSNSHKVKPNKHIE